MANDYLLKTWREIAYNQEQTQEQYNQFWGAYFVQEKEVYKDILGHPDVVVKGTVEELAKKYNMEVLTMVGFLDGINESLKVENPIEELEDTTEVSLEYDPEKLYKNMVDALDEMTICSIGTYVIDKINEQDAKLLASKGIK